MALLRRGPSSASEYRIAIMASVLLFGLARAKAMLGYLGYSVAADTVDWVFGVAVTTAYAVVSETN